jgi:hypothetical protein
VPPEHVLTWAVAAQRGRGPQPSKLVMRGSISFARSKRCVSSSDLAPLVVMNPGSSIPAELKAWGDNRRHGQLVDLDAAAAELTRRRAEWVSGGLTVGEFTWRDAAAWDAAPPAHVRMLRCHLARMPWILPALPSGA